MFNRALQDPTSHCKTTTLKNVQLTREGVVSVHSVGCTGAAQADMTCSWAPPESGHAAMLWGGKAIWVYTGVIIGQRGAVCLS